MLLFTAHGEASNHTEQRVIPNGMGIVAYCHPTASVPVALTAALSDPSNEGEGVLAVASVWLFTVRQEWVVWRPGLPALSSLALLTGGNAYIIFMDNDRVGRRPGSDFWLWDTGCVVGQQSGHWSRQTVPDSQRRIERGLCGTV